jgi:hypothetical protein
LSFYNIGSGGYFPRRIPYRQEKEDAGPVADAYSSSHPARCRDPAAGEQAFGATRNENWCNPLAKVSGGALQSLVDRSALNVASQLILFAELPRQRNLRNSRRQDHHPAGQYPSAKRDEVERSKIAALDLRRQEKQIE